MNFYLDFEATQFTNQIISIGCVSETGEEFYTLVNPGEKEKISQFITELTGITKDMLSAAPDPDEAFRRLYNFIYSCNHWEEPHYFCYGDNDKDFIKASIKNMGHIESIMVAQSILYALKDYSKDIKKFFNIDQAIALRKLFSFIHQDDVVQRHNALEDAQMLCEVANKMKEFQKDDLEKIRSIPNQDKPKMPVKRAPEKFINMTGSRWNVQTGTPQNYKIKCTRGGLTKYFTDMEMASLWVLKYITGGSPKREDVINRRASAIRKAIKNGTKYCGFVWEGR